MPLVAYDDSSSDDETSANASDHASSRPSPRKRRRIYPSTSRLTDQPKDALPPLPPSFRDLYATNTRASTKDDPSLHGGRKRQVPHIEGNWPTHIFIEWYPDPTQEAALTALIASVTTPSLYPPDIHTAVKSDLGVSLPLHISLSAPLLLRTEQRNAFLAAATRAIRRACPRGCFNVALHGLDWTSNAEGSRWFLAQRIARPAGDELNRLLHECNTVSSEFGLPRLYSGAKDEAGDLSARFHFSIGWTLKAPLDTDTGPGQRTGPAQAAKDKRRAVEDISVRVEMVKIKIGNAVTAVEFDTRRA